MDVERSWWFVGLKYGIYSSAGSLTCAGRPASLAIVFEDIDVSHRVLLRKAWHFEKMNHCVLNYYHIYTSQAIQWTLNSSWRLCRSEVRHLLVRRISHLRRATGIPRLRRHRCPVVRRVGCRLPEVRQLLRRGAAHDRTFHRCVTC